MPSNSPIVCWLNMTDLSSSLVVAAVLALCSSIRIRSKVALMESARAAWKVRARPKVVFRFYITETITRNKKIPSPLLHMYYVLSKSLKIIPQPTMKLSRASLIQQVGLSSRSSRIRTSTPAKVFQSYNYCNRYRSFSSNVSSLKPKQCRPTRIKAPTCSPVTSTSFIYVNRCRSTAARYASNQAEPSALSPSSPPTTASTTGTTQHRRYNSLINPPTITLPPPLDIPERKAGQFFIAYLYSRGRAYLNFFKSGLKNAWAMYRMAQVIKKKQDISNNASQTKQPLTSNFNDPQPPSIPSITRAEFQLLQRNSTALSKVAPFGLFVLIFAEFSPLLLVYMTGIAPEPCQLPSVQEKIEKKFNERKFKSFIRYKEHVENTETGREDMRLLKAMSSDGDGGTSSAPLTSTHSTSVSPGKESTASLIDTLSTPSLHHASTAVKAHSAILDRFSFNPLTSRVTSFLLTRDYLTRCIRQRLAYLRTDDALLLRDGSVEELSSAELKRAVAERGYLSSAAMGVSDGMRKKQLKEWIGRSIGRKASARPSAGGIGEDGLIRLVLED